MKPRNVVKKLSILLVAVSFGLAAAQHESPAYDRLKNVSQFAFGGVGYAGNYSQGELDYRALMRQPVPLALAELEKLYAEGNPQAKAYALAGLHVLNPERFRELTVTLSKDAVSTERGCFVSTEPLTSLAKEIATGMYDKQALTPAPPATPPPPPPPPSPPPPTPPHPTA